MNWHHEGFAYRGGADLLLQVGQFYTGRELPAQYQKHFGAEGECFENALRAATEDPSLRYCEGVYMIGGGHPTPHAWCLDPSGQLLEVTFPTDPDILKIGREARSKLPILPVEHWGYWGAVFHPEYVRRVFDLQDGCGLLDRPVHDRLDAEPGMAVDEWREDWHVLHYPYDPERRSP